MTTPKVVTVYGTRPELIKTAPVIAGLGIDDRFTSVAVSTGQQRDLLDQVNRLFGIKPSYDLGIMKPGQTLNEMVARMMTGLDEVFEKEQPDMVLVQGDTSTAMAGAIVGFHRGVKVVHLEAGLRTGNIASPFPEEGYRCMISQIASLHLAPTPESRQNLLDEDFPAADIAITGNTVIDALLHTVSLETTYADPALQEVTATDKDIVLVTTHRRENLHAMKAIGAAVHRLATAFPDTEFVCPLHPNPRVREVIIPLIDADPNVLVTTPLPYNEFCALMNRAKLVVTDSGGVQEEAPALGKPVLVMRDTTERPEAVSYGTVKLVGTNEDDIVNEATTLLTDDTAYAAMANAVNPYGDGDAVPRVLAAMAQLAGVGERLEDFRP
ncbi:MULTISPECIES: non-hydrolyzing UDP-N-acetylglucosamine 2-epimerase [Corynebacterium]|uniref:UDP-N-acetylglucosamine 2-epimerase (non-hydrolyzing) n=1 Tax=Corynebacterium glucuronolyticum TaxID=39791 RepID=A0A7T4EG09_9CORY|nr:MULTISPECIES: UDP-N-acetylglucosamine 2-epimerase (non-hydrolyzing) [Corynebacterium]MCT1442179.1 UDP-N-acetylglucosamine 2-epimerase (non-hydrolyzing) [Corynebacterium glucuronolyticum]OFO44165.1 UDP-N-acetyl glucosamine 2-epimerase [Corynebacterium sp. HMSC073D01]QQB46699.1 UDP-N-acetylglucosamine 2-epimerase (non-hydrolyzing) [Corynebacterium glucuronolyticum]QQU88305.1 UDP-N-acetylglucosamine 2-epimerase (non-hydrolyzing) [Corynebacterium glucuronolyticum]WKD62486.1 UDP-N-acetylglucosam